jgi:hypothetical protein
METLRLFVKIDFPPESSFRVDTSSMLTHVMRGALVFVHAKCAIGRMSETWKNIFVL